MALRRTKIIIKKNLENIIDKIDHIYYINLDERKDRLENILKQVKLLDKESIKTTRISAIKNDIGAIGCGLSHIKTLEDAKKNNYKQVIILEDDFEFILDKDEINKILDYFLNEVNEYNICLLAGNIYKVSKYKKFIYEAINIQTTSGYLIHEKFYDILIDNFKNSVEKMISNYKYGESEIDVSWKKLQGKDKQFYIINPRLGKQISGYSDIEKRHVNYNC